MTAKYVDDPTLTWEERYARLEAHHIEETTALFAKLTAERALVTSTKADLLKVSTTLNDLVRRGPNRLRVSESVAADRAAFYADIDGVIDVDKVSVTLEIDLLENARRSVRKLFAGVRRRLKGGR